MIVDSSAIVAILRRESDAKAFARAIEQAPTFKMSAANYLETAIVVDMLREPLPSRRLDDFIAQSAITIEPVTETHARIAREAYREYGKGGGHAASLNFGDCFAYALSRATGEPLLFKGIDLARTDVASALA